MLGTKDTDNKVFYHIYPWGETLAYIAWLIRASYHLTIGDTRAQSVFGIDMIFNLASVVYCRVITTKKNQQVDIDNVQENSSWVIHDYAVGDLLCA